jgi:AcrR family transcriptional regulator
LTRIQFWSHDERVAENRDAEGRAERAERILDAAAELLLRHGYHRVTVEDVATRGGVGKGTLYLHWRTRRELFTAVLVRDVSRAFDEVADALEADPQAWRLSRVARAFFVSILTRPLLTAVIREDPEIVGRLGLGDLQQRYGRRVTLLGQMFEALTALGLLREDLPIEDLSLAFRATTEGFLMIDLIELASGAPPDRPPMDVEKLADLLAATVQGAFESGRTVSDEVSQSLRRDVARQLREVAAADRAGLGIGVVPAPVHTEA